MISVTFTADVENIVATEHLYQWDNGQKLSISGVGTTADIHFANKKSEKALVVTPTITSGAMVAFIPNSLLADPYPILAYVYVPSDNGSKTIKSVTIYVEARKQPSDFVLEEDEGVTTLESISQRVNEMIQSATNQINTAVSNMQTDYGNFKTTIQSELADMVANTTIPNADTVDGHHASDFALAENKFMDDYLSSKTGDIRVLIKDFPSGGFGGNTGRLPNITGFPITGDILITWSKSVYSSSNGFRYGTLQVRSMTKGNLPVYQCSVYNDGVYTDWQKLCDGGNADTLDGKHVSDFYQIAAGLRTGTGSKLDIFSTTLSSDHPCWNKWECVVGNSKDTSSSDYIINAPESSGALWYEVFTGGIANRAFQIAFGCFRHQRKTFIRYKHDSVWSGWHNIADGGNANTANTAGTLATTPTNVCLRNISFGTANPQVTDSSAEGYVAEGALYGQYV